MSNNWRTRRAFRSLDREQKKVRQRIQEHGEGFLGEIEIFGEKINPKAWISKFINETGNAAGLPGQIMAFVVNKVVNAGTDEFVFDETALLPDKEQLELQDAQKMIRGQQAGQAAFNQLSRDIDAWWDNKAGGTGQAGKEATSKEKRKAFGDYLKEKIKKGEGWDVVKEWITGDWAKAAPDPLDPGQGVLQPGSVLPGSGPIGVLAPSDPKSKLQQKASKLSSKIKQGWKSPLTGQRRYLKSDFIPDLITNIGDIPSKLKGQPIINTLLQQPIKQGKAPLQSKFNYTKLFGKKITTKRIDELVKNIKKLSAKKTI